MAKFCTNCGAPLGEGHLFCVECGTKIKQAPVEVKVEETAVAEPVTEQPVEIAADEPVAEQPVEIVAVEPIAEQPVESAVAEPVTENLITDELTEIKEEAVSAVPVAAVVENVFDENKLLNEMPGAPIYAESEQVKVELAQTAAPSQSPIYPSAASAQTAAPSQSPVYPSAASAQTAAPSQSPIYPSAAPAQNTAQSPAYPGAFPMPTSVPQAPNYNGPVQRTAQAPVAPAVAVDDKETRVVSTAAFFWLEVLYAIPFVGFISAVIIAASAKNKNIAHHASSKLVKILVAIILSIVFCIISAIAIQQAGLTLDDLMNTYGSYLY